MSAETTVCEVFGWFGMSSMMTGLKVTGARRTLHFYTTGLNLLGGITFIY